ncbi:MAG: AAA family ATPase [Myxococcales bacterium]|jgi:ATP-dependent Clp protease ATP-binding subunit ClpC|nr:AAA family ATPase [Myxococcales bacterium]
MAVDSAELKQVLVESADIAAQAGQQETTAHLLLALFTTPNRAQLLLDERGVNVERLLMVVSRAFREEAQQRREAIERAREIAEGCRVAETDCVHLLIAMTRARGCTAFQMLQACGVNVSSLRNTALSYYLGAPPPRCWNQLHEPSPSSRTATTASVPSPHELLTGRPPPSARFAAADAAGVRQPLSSAPPSFLLSKIPTNTPGQRPARISAIPHKVSQTSTIEPSASQAEPPTNAREHLGPLPKIEASIESIGGFEPLPLPRPISRAGAPISRWQLDPVRFPTLCELGRNLSELASQNRLDPVIGREREIDEIIDILGKRRTNNPCLLGEPGVGKTAVVEGVAQALVALAERGATRQDKILVELDVASLVAGTQLRGAFSERLGAIKDEVRAADGKVVVFIDELHTLIGAGATGEGPQDAANELKSVLARGDFPCIGATTHDEFRKHVRQDPAMERRFTPVRIDEPSVDDTVAILKGIVERYEAHHGVHYAPEALVAAASLSAKHIAERFLPDKAISVIDLTGSRARREGISDIGVREIARTISRLSGVPEERLTLSDAGRLLQLESDLKAHVIGHTEVIERVAQVLRRNYAGFSSHRPMGSFLFLGPTGVGKTELSKALAEVLFGAREALVRLDMSECVEKTGVARLLGAAPGYVGFGEGGQLTEPVRRRPSSVVLFDEIEKAHSDVLMLLLQVLEEGSLTDGSGRRVDFSNSVVILTSNLGAEHFGKARAAVGFGAAALGADGWNQAERALEAARGQIAPELWNRLDERLCFLPLGRDEVARIALLLLSDSSQRLSADKGLAYTASSEVVEHLLDSGGFDPTLGARPMRRTVQRLVEAPLADAILDRRFQRGDRIAVEMAGAEIVFRRA